MVSILGLVCSSVVMVKLCCVMKVGVLMCRFVMVLLLFSWGSSG